MVIDRANGKNKIENLIPNPIMERIIKVSSRLEDISFLNIYCELKDTVDKLSKDLSLPQGWVIWCQWNKRGWISIKRS